MEKEKINRCENFTLYCYKVKETAKMFVLSCTMNRKKQDSEEYTAPVYLDVLCIKDKCKGVDKSNLEEYVKTSIRVNGNFMPDEFTMQTGSVVGNQKIWADEVWKTDFSEKADYNRCDDWCMFCHEQKATENAITLNCSMNRKKQEGGYTKAITVYVVCPADSCDIEKDAYAESLILASGRFLPDEYTTKEGQSKAVMKIFADKVVKKPHK